MALIDISPLVEKLERLETIEGLLVEIRDAFTHGVVIPASSLPAGSDPDRVKATPAEAARVGGWICPRCGGIARLGTHGDPCRACQRATQ